MIVDHISQIEKYRQLGVGFSEGIDFILEHPAETLLDGRYEISANVYMLLNSYQTKPEAECFFEAHQERIDLQLMIQGDEAVRWAPVGALRRTESFSDRDLYKYAGNGEIFPLVQHSFMIMFPSDAHMPSIMVGEESELVRKLVLKIRADTVLIR